MLAPGCLSQLVVSSSSSNNQSSRCWVELRPRDLLCLIASFLDLRDHFRLLGVCKAMEVVCRQPASFAPVVDISSQGALTLGLTKLAEYRVRPAGLLASHIRGEDDDAGRRVPDAFVSWLASGGSAQLTRLDLAAVTNAQRVLDSLPLASRHRLRELGLRAVLRLANQEYDDWDAIDPADRALIIRSRAKALAIALVDYSELRSLDLADNMLGAYGDTAVATGLGDLTQLTSLDLGFNHLQYCDSAGSAALSTALGKLTRLTSVTVAGNWRIWPRGGLVLAGPFWAPSLGLLPQLRSLDLAHNWLLFQDGAYTAALATAVAQLTQLTCLNLAHNQLGGTGAAALAGSVGRLTQLTCLNLAHNSLGYHKGAGAAALAPALGKLTGLRSLNLATTSLGRDQGAGAAALAPALGKLTGLTCLDLDYNGLSKDPRPAGYDILRAVLDQLPHLAVGPMFF